MRLFYASLIFLTLFCLSNAQELKLNIRHPADQDTLDREKTRFDATVSDTSAIVKINGVQKRVYSSGVFVSLLELQPGWNHFIIEAKSDKGFISDTIDVFRTAPLISLPSMPTVFGKEKLLPVSDVTFFEAGELVVQFMGSPGGKAFFEIDDLIDDALPMVELDSASTDGIGGIYRGVYHIRPGDECENEAIEFTLVGVDGEEEWETERKVTVKQTGQPYLIETVCEENLVYYQPGGEIFLNLPQKIRLPVIARNERWLHVRITPDLTGYISARCAEILGYGDRTARGIFGGFSSGYENDWLVFSFNLHERIPFKINQKKSPQSIELSLYNTHVRDEWTVLPDDDSVTNPDSSFLTHFEWMQKTDSELCLTFYLNTVQQWGYRAWYEDNLFKFAIRKPPVIQKDSLFSNLIIALDAGHGGEHSGAVGATGYAEKDANLKYTGYLAELLKEAGATVILTRTTDTTMYLKPRADIAREHNAHMLVWLHNNAIGSSSDPEAIKGTSTYYTHIQGLPFALYVYPELLDLGLDPFGRVHRTYYITRQSDFVVFLVEGAFLSNPEDEIFLMDDENLKKLAKAVFKGMKNYLLRISK